MVSLLINWNAESGRHVNDRSGQFTHSHEPQPSEPVPTHPSGSWQKGLSAEPDLTREEFVQWSLASRAAFLSGEDSVLQHKTGMLDEAAFRSYEAGARAFLAFPGFRAMWHVSRAQYGPDFQHFVDSLLTTLPDVPPPDLYAVWQERLKAELRKPRP